MKNYLIGSVTVLSVVAMAWLQYWIWGILIAPETFTTVLLCTLSGAIITIFSAYGIANWALERMNE